MKKFLFVLGGILLITALFFNINITLNQTELSGVTILTAQNTALADGENNDGFLELNTYCLDWGFLWDPVCQCWTPWQENGHITECFIDFLNLGCDAHTDCDSEYD